jgi:cyclopropane fatty-acyl-phospholipid synthase-like methyltransferase
MHPQQDLKYLIYLAEQGKSYLHPHGEAATDCLIEALEIESGYKILDIGCGTGETMIRILSTYNVTIDAIDLLPEMREKANLRLKVTGLKDRGKVFNYSNNGKFPFVSGCYDSAYAESVIGFQDESGVKSLLGEAKRVLKKDALFALNDAIWKKNASFDDITRINKSCIEDFGLTQASVQPWFIDDWRRIFKEAEFEIITDNLISDLLGKSDKRRKSGIFKSAIISKFFQIKGMLTPSLWKKHLRYKKLLEKHSGDGNYIESRLFVLKKK